MILMKILGRASAQFSVQSTLPIATLGGTLSLIPSLDKRLLHSSQKARTAFRCFQQHLFSENYPPVAMNSRAFLSPAAKSNISTTGSISIQQPRQCSPLTSPTLRSSSVKVSSVAANFTTSSCCAHGTSELRNAESGSSQGKVSTITLPLQDALLSKDQADEFVRHLTDEQKKILYHCLNIEVLRGTYDGHLGSTPLDSANYLSKFGRPTAAIIGGKEDSDPTSKWLHTRLVTPELSLRSDESGGFSTKPSGAGKRLILNYIGSVNGFLPNVGETFEGNKKSKIDYHKAMNSDHFEKWLKTIIREIPNKSVIVLDQATYHKRVIEETKNPTTAWRKQNIIDWLIKNRIPIPHGITSYEKMTIPLLLKLAKDNRIQQKYAVEEMIKTSDKDLILLWLPVAHCELNPIELIWAQVKNGKSLPVTAKAVWAVGLKNAMPFIGFGFLDNLIMILAGDYIDLTIGAALGISTMAAAALGNTISDVAGIASAWYVEALAEKVGIHDPKLTPGQWNTWRVRWAANIGRAVGVVIGCLLGMVPLIFLPSAEEKKEREETAQKARDAISEKENRNSNAKVGEKSESK